MTAVTRATLVLSPGRVPHGVSPSQGSRLAHAAQRLPALLWGRSRGEGRTYRGGPWTSKARRRVSSRCKETPIFVPIPNTLRGAAVLGTGEHMPSSYRKGPHTAVEIGPDVVPIELH